VADAPSGRILIADDEPLFLRTTSQLLTKAGYECVGVPDGAAALERLEGEHFDLVLSDLNMPGNLKLELLREGRGKWPSIPLIVVTGAPTMLSAIESVRLGIADYLLKPVKYQDLLAGVQRALAHARRAAHPPESPRPAGRFPEIIGESGPMKELFEIVDRVAATDANVLITGESGTGKEVVAGAIHRRSLRAGGALQVIDCTAVPETLFESVLFGHAKGAFTGAVKDQVGLLSMADGGTAFFDEIGELPPPLQAKLLRVIQEQTFTPLGKASPERIDTRFICATNRDLESEIQAGRFRRDLFYRLAVIHIELPPLHARGNDVELLARHFLEQLRGTRRPEANFADETLALLRQYAWPGNIRELRNAVEHALAVSRHDTIVPGDMPAALRRPTSAASASGETEPPAPSRADALRDAERNYLAALLRQNDGNIARAARQADMSRQGLHKLLKKHGLPTNERRP
jgi:two-component system, NtrC family, response regulator AtoC